MKTLLLTLLAALLLTLAALPAAAEAASSAPDENGALAPYTWEGLATMAGATAAVLLIVQYTKTWLDMLVHIPTRAIVLVLSAAILIGANAALYGISWMDIPPLLLNAVLVATSAMGAYEVTFAKIST